MENVKTVLRLDLKSAFNSWVELRNVMRKLSEKTDLDIQGGTIVMDVVEKKQRAELLVGSVILHQEGNRSLEQISDILTKKVEDINSVSPIPVIGKFICETEFIEPKNLPFYEILSLLKNRFLKNNSIANSATDIALIFDEVDGKIVKHLQFGPMDKTQLTNQYIIWKIDKLPENFIFAICSYSLTNETNYSSEILKKFLNDSLKWQQDNVSTLFELLNAKEN